ncbi:MAG: GNAT family N-acetyltransferase [Nostocoides sp.]
MTRSTSAAPAPSFPRIVPVLTDGTVTLRAHQRADVDAIVEQCADPESMAWTSVPRPYRKADALRFLALIREAWGRPDGNRYWAIEVADESTGAPVYAGTIDLRPRPGRIAEIGFGLHPAARGRGVMAAAVRLLAAYGFEEGLGDGSLDRIHWAARVGNFASRRVAWACGFVQHGTIPQMPGPTSAGPAGERVPCDHWVASLSRLAPMVPLTPWLDIPVIEDDGVRLRAWREDDIEHAEPLDGPSHHMPLGAAPSDLTFEYWLLVRRERAARGEGITWCIADARTDRPLGAVMVFDHGAPISEPGAELGYFLFPSARGRGVATAASDLAVDHAFAPKAKGGLGLSRLSAVTAADNVASNSVLERLGFVRWGVEHATDLLPDGTWENAYHWELLRSLR